MDTMFREDILLVGVGAAGNKAVMDTIAADVIDEKDTIIINSTSRDFPASYNGKKIILSAVDTGCGKERHIAKGYAEEAMAAGKFNFDNVDDHSTVIVVTSVEGGTGSGSAPIIAKLFKQVYKRNVHIIAFTGFEDDVRGLRNTVEFFKELDDTMTVQTISNAKFMQQARGNKLRAEELANKEFAERIRVMTGQDMIQGKQNIDATDLNKLINTTGYMTVEKKYINQPLETREDYDKIIKNMMYNSASIHLEDPKALLVGVIFNVSEESKDAIDFQFDELKSSYAKPGIIYDTFTQDQWDGKKEYIAYIVSGMRMPIDEVKAIYDRYVEQTNTIDKKGDSFFHDVQALADIEEDNRFNTLRDTETKGMSIADFLSNN